MKIRMKVEISGGRGGVEWPKIGETLEVGDEEGVQLCAGGMAEPVAELDTDVETAVAPAAEERGLTTETGPVRRGPGRPRKTEGSGAS